jgi:hypothetical protein
MLVLLAIAISDRMIASSRSNFCIDNRVMTEDYNYFEEAPLFVFIRQDFCITSL